MTRTTNRVVRSFHYKPDRVFEVVVGDLLSENTDCLVNAANSRLEHGGGVAAVIADAAGPSLVAEGESIVRDEGPIATGKAVVTTAGRLPFKAIIHSVGPLMGAGNEEELLTAAIYSAFHLAHERGWRSVSFPAVSSGIFGVPHSICINAYLIAVGKFWRGYPDSSVTQIRLVLFEGQLLEELMARLADVVNFPFTDREGTSLS